MGRDECYGSPGISIFRLLCPLVDPWTTVGSATMVMCPVSVVGVPE